MNKPNKIIPSSYELTNGKYVPQVTLVFVDGPTTRRELKPWRNKAFNTKKEADKYAMRQAEIYVASKF